MRDFIRRLLALELELKPKAPFLVRATQGATREEALAKYRAAWPSSGPVIVAPAPMTPEEWVKTYGHPAEEAVGAGGSNSNTEVHPNENPK